MADEALKIRWNTKRHTKILAAVINRFDRSKDKMEEMYSNFKDREEQFLAYMPERSLDTARRVDREENGNPQYTTITVPFSYSQLMTAHTYWTSVFLSRTPVFQYIGRHGETVDQEMGVEALIDYQVQQAKMVVPLTNWLLDPGKYGFGVVGHYWMEEERVVSQIVEKPITIAGFAIAGKSRKVMETRKIAGYKGNKIFNVSPRNFFPDPSVPLSRLQEGEFCGRTTTVNWNTIVRRAEQGTYFNIDVLKKMNSSTRNRDREEGSEQMEWPEPETEHQHVDPEDVNSQELLEMTVELIPREWEVGAGSFPQKWVFTIANEELIIGAQPLGALHDQFPFDVVEYEPEAYALFNRGMLETVAPMNDVMTWLVNSHMYNVRQTLNNQFIGDPSRISLGDLKNPDPGFIARVKPAGYGQDVRTMLTQLPVADMTQNHLRDMQVMERMVQQVTGVTDNIMGMVNPGGRKTATEVRTSSSAGANRLKTQAEYFSAMGWSGLAEKMLSNTQQRYDGEQKFRIVGDLVEGSDPFVNVSPERIAGAYDWVPVDGTLPVDRFAQANLFRQIFADLRQFPQLQAEFDMARVFSYVAKLAGAKNFDRFKVQTLPDEQVQNEVQKGNLVPVNGGAVRELANRQEPGQIANVGASG